MYIPMPNTNTLDDSKNAYPHMDGNRQKKGQSCREEDKAAKLWLQFLTQQAYYRVTVLYIL